MQEAASQPAKQTLFCPGFDSWAVCLLGMRPRRECGDVLFRLSSMVPWIEVGCNVNFSLLWSERSDGERTLCFITIRAANKGNKYEIWCSKKEHGC